jgi:hypothetical protein
VGSVVAPTTLLTALMLYFGRLHATGLCDYFGMHYTVLDLTAQDYLVRSADGFIVPLVMVVGTALVALWAHQLLVGALPAAARQIMLRALIPFAAIAGMALVVLAIADTVAGGIFDIFPEGRGLSLSSGVLLLAYTTRLARLLAVERRRGLVVWRVPGGLIVAEWTAVFILVSVGLFWAVGNYAWGVGTGRAQQFEASLSTLPDVVLYSEKGLGLEAPGVHKLQCQDSETAYRFRYDGLKMVLQSGNQYLLLPAGWSHTAGAAILIPRKDTLRLEFSGAGQKLGTIC